MTYLYSQTNRLVEPHKYMYAEFQGEPFLDAYLNSRLEVIRRCDSIVAGEETLDQELATQALTVLEGLFGVNSAAIEQFFALMKIGSVKATKQSKANPGVLNHLATSLETMTPTEPVTTLDLLHSLVAVQLTNPQGCNIKIWLDRLVQRFEVTKKLYESYPAGFRKGEGENTSVRLYWLFSLVLCLFYLHTHGLKYLNALLKVNDLLCSLPENLLRAQMPVGGFRTVLAAEVVSVQSLAERGGLSFAFK